jgi:hypothetical protein
MQHRDNTFKAVMSYTKKGKREKARHKIYLICKICGNITQRNSIIQHAGICTVVLRYDILLHSVEPVIQPYNYGKYLEECSVLTLKKIYNDLLQCVQNHDAESQGNSLLSCA